MSIGFLFFEINDVHDTKRTEQILFGILEKSVEKFVALC